MTAPTSFGLAFFLRVGLPGLTGVALLIPLFPRSVNLGVSAEGLATLLGFAAITGLLLSLLDTPIYRILEGRLLWPSWLRGKWTKRQESKVQDLQRRLNRLQEELEIEEGQAQPDLSVIRWKKREMGLVADSLLDFPWDERGEPWAFWPTRFGNVLASWEDYPETRYGMDSTFYWYRLWLVADDSDRKEIDTNWAFAQVWAYIAFAALIAGLAYGSLGIWFLLRGLSEAAKSPAWLGSTLGYLLDLRPAGRLFPISLSSTELALRLLLLTVGSALAFRIAYWIAVMQHRVSGEFYKALFDLHRHELMVVPEGADHPQNWQTASTWLRYMRGDKATLRRRWTR